MYEPPLKKYKQYEKVSNKKKFEKYKFGIVSYRFDIARRRFSLFCYSLRRELIKISIKTIPEDTVCHIGFDMGNEIF
jgi:hypothetical protein